MTDQQYHVTPEQLIQTIAAVKALPENPSLSQAIQWAEDMLANPSEHNRRCLNHFAFLAMRDARLASAKALDEDFENEIPSASKAAYGATAAMLAWMPAALPIPSSQTPKGGA